MRAVSIASLGTENDVSLRVVEAIADHRGVDPVDLPVPLFEVVDPDALDRLFASPDGDASGGVDGVTFSYDGLRVRVAVDGEIRISDPEQ